MGAFRQKKALLFKLIGNLPVFHDHDAMAHKVDCGQIMGNKQIGKPHIILQIFEEVEDLRLTGDIQACRRLIKDD